MSTPGKPSRNAAASPNAAVEDLSRTIHTVFRQHGTTPFVLPATVERARTPLAYVIQTERRA
jgi:hypothetical protein